MRFKRRSKGLTDVIIKKIIILISEYQSSKSLKVA